MDNGEILLLKIDLFAGNNQLFALNKYWLAINMKTTIAFIDLTYKGMARFLAMLK